MSADPDPAASPEPTPSGAPPPPGSVREKLPMPQAKRRYKKDPASDVPDVEEAPAGARSRRGGEVSEPPADAPARDDQKLDEEIEQLNALLRQLTARRRETSASPAAEPEARGVKYHRLTKKNPPPAARDPAAPTAEGAAPAATATPALVPAPAAEGGVASPAPLARGLDDFLAGYRGPWHPGWLLATLGILVLGALAFSMGRMSIGPAAAPETAAPTPAPSWSAADITQLDKVLAIDSTGDLLSAYTQGKSLDEQLHGRADLERYLAVLQGRRGGISDAEADLIRGVTSTTPPLLTAALENRLGFVYARRRDFKAASESFAAAAAADPFDARAFYHWGESLRRLGRLPEAAQRFQQALLRLPAGDPESDSLRQSAAFGLRLTQIELGDDAAVKSTFDAQLRQPAPNAYWLLTAVAYDLQHNDVPSAVATLQHAQDATPPGQIDLLFNDYFLRGLASRSKEVASYAPEMTAARRRQLDASGAYFIDP